MLNPPSLLEALCRTRTGDPFLTMFRPQSRSLDFIGCRTQGGWVNA